MRVHFSGARYSLLKTNIYLFLEVWLRDLYFEETQKSIQDIIGVLEVSFVQHDQTKCQLKI